MKYELTDITMEWHGNTLYRIRALHDIPGAYVRAGDLGGYVAGERNLSQTGSSWVRENALVAENACVSEDAVIAENAMITENAFVGGRARVTATALVTGFACVGGHAWVGGDAWVLGNTWIGGYSGIIGGVWEKTPLQIQGSKWWCNMSSDKLWKMGCCTYELREWVERFDEITEEHYQQHYATEYWRYVRLACEMYAPELAARLEGDARSGAGAGGGAGGHAAR